MYHHARKDKLHFYETTNGVRRAAKRGDFVRLSGNENYTLHGVSFPYVKPATRTFVRRLSNEYRDACGEVLVVTSAVRPESRQPANSVARSVHPTGMAVDLRKPDGKCLSWLRHTLLSLERTGILEVTEEHHPAHFHVAVYQSTYKKYVARLTHRADERDTRVASASDADIYRVRRGDSLWSIARHNGTSVAALKRANDLSDSDIMPGQHLVIPAD